MLCKSYDRSAGGLFVPLTRWVQHPPDPDQISSDQSRTPVTLSILESLLVKLEAFACDDIFGFHGDTPTYKDMVKKTNKKNIVMN